jgi:hypothetical protein
MSSPERAKPMRYNACWSVSLILKSEAHTVDDKFPFDATVREEGRIQGLRSQAPEGDGGFDVARSSHPAMTSSAEATPIAIGTAPLIDIEIRLVMQKRSSARAQRARYWRPRGLVYTGL